MDRTTVSGLALITGLLGFALTAFGADRGGANGLSPIFDDAGRGLRGVFDGLPPNARLATDEALFKAVPFRSCNAPLKHSSAAPEAGGAWQRVRAFVKRIFSVPVAFAIDCPWCSEPGNCTGQHFTCSSLLCFDGCGGSYNRCYTTPVAPAWVGYCVSNEIVCPACPQCQERTCWNG